MNGRGLRSRTADDGKLGSRQNVLGVRVVTIDRPSTFRGLGLDLLQTLAGFLLRLSQHIGWRVVFDLQEATIQIVDGVLVGGANVASIPSRACGHGLLFRLFRVALRRHVLGLFGIAFCLHCLGLHCGMSFHELL